VMACRTSVAPSHFNLREAHFQEPFPALHFAAGPSEPCRVASLARTTRRISSRSPRREWPSRSRGDRLFSRDRRQARLATCCDGTRPLHRRCPQSMPAPRFDEFRRTVAPRAMDTLSGAVLAGATPQKDQETWRLIDRLLPVRQLHHRLHVGPQHGIADRVPIGHLGQCATVMGTKPSAA